VVIWRTRQPAPVREPHHRHGLRGRRHRPQAPARGHRRPARASRM